MDKEEVAKLEPNQYYCKYSTNLLAEEMKTLPIAINIFFSKLPSKVWVHFGTEIYLFKSIH